MRQGQSNKRSRNRGGRKGGQGFSLNRSMDSNGPDIKVRGTAQTIYDRYLQFARDASSSGDNVHAENYLQHAEHYYRLLQAMQAVLQQQRQNRAIQNGQGNGADEGSTNSDEQPSSAAEETEVEKVEAESDAGEEAEKPAAEAKPRRRRIRKQEVAGDVGLAEDSEPEVAAAE